MGWEIGYDGNWDRDIGYGIPAECDHPDCDAQIDRGISYVCGQEPYGGEHGCGLFFCTKHLSGYIEVEVSERIYDSFNVCERCEKGQEAFEPKSDVEEWVHHKATDPSWSLWRKEEGIPG